MRAWLPIPVELEEVPCALCGSRTRDPLLPHDWFGFPIGLVGCRDCGFVYCSPRPTEEFIDRFYRRHYLLFYEGWSELTDEYVRAHQLREAARDRVARYAALVPAGGRVLDVGCGPAFFLGQLRQARPDVRVQGIEPGRIQARYANHVVGVPVFEGMYQAFEDGRLYDLVTAFHIAEHVPDLNGFVQFLRARMAPQGHVVVESPNLEGTWRDLSMFHVAHLYAFTPASIVAFGRKHALEPVQVRTSDAGWDWPNLHVVLRAMTAPETGAGRSVFISAVDRERLLHARRSRALCVVRSWAKLLLRYVGLGRRLDLWRLRRAQSA